MSEHLRSLLRMDMYSCINSFLCNPLNTDSPRITSPTKPRISVVSYDGLNMRHPCSDFITIFAAVVK